MISIIIPTYTHTEKLLKNIRHNLRYFEESDEIIVVNDNPQRILTSYFREFPRIILIEHKKNTGFGTAVNDGVAIAHHPIFLLLNDDVVLKDASHRNAAEQLRNDQNTFAISFAQEQNNGSILGKNSIFWHHGLPMHQSNMASQTPYTAWAEGGAAVFDKSKWEALGGLSPMYDPFYWEDIDISFRAWKMGYKVKFDKNIVVRHQHESTIGSVYSRKKIAEIAFRNQFLFTWNTITDTRLRISHLFWLPFNMIYYGIYKHQFSFVVGFFTAIWYIIAHGIVQKKVQYKNSDAQIFGMFL